MRPQLNRSGLKYLRRLKNLARVIITICPVCQERPIFAGKLTCNVCETLHINEVGFKGRTFSRKLWK